MQKIYCYVDETGQDEGSKFFIVVAVISDKEQDFLRKQLLEIEFLSKVGKRKWHKSYPETKKRFLKLVLEKRICEGEIYFSYYEKPLPYFLPFLDILEKAILDKAKENYKAVIYVDGIDKKKAAELTNALRVKRIKLDLVKSRRDESEPLIRLADRWAGCIRAAFLGKVDEKDILNKAREKNYIKKI